MAKRKWHPRIWLSISRPRTIVCNNLYTYKYQVAALPNLQ